MLPSESGLTVSISPLLGHEILANKATNMSRGYGMGFDLAGGCERRSMHCEGNHEVVELLKKVFFERFRVVVRIVWLLDFHGNLGNGRDYGHIVRLRKGCGHPGLSWMFRTIERKCPLDLHAACATCRACRPRRRFWFIAFFILVRSAPFSTSARSQERLILPVHIYSYALWVGSFTIKFHGPMYTNHMKKQ